MKPTARLYEAISHPTFAFATTSSTYFPKSQDKQLAPVPWSASNVNPKNLITSFEPLANPTWEIDGCEGHVNRLFIIPKFARGKSPLRIDTCIPDPESYDQQLRSLLQHDRLCYASSSTVKKLNLVRHVLRALEVWSQKQPNFESIYINMPFGSRIVIDDIQTSIQKMNIHFFPRYEVEKQWLTIRQLQKLWGLSESQWPPVVDIQLLELQHQLYENITLVKIKNFPSDCVYIFKSLLHDLKYMYHELKLLLTMKPHPNIISRPLCIVTKKCRFGNKPGVCGFVLEYYQGDTLQVALSKQYRTNQTDWHKSIRWAQEITRALQHIQNDTPGFYSDLKPNNILLSQNNVVEHIIIIDFEQRNNWYSWSPPEVLYIQYYEYLASLYKTNDILFKVYRDKLSQYITNKGLSRITDHCNPAQNFNISWLSLTKVEQESAMVFTLGKMLWCIFECCWTIDSVPNYKSFQLEPCERKFPEFQKTPERLRTLIKKCTSGAHEWRTADFSATKRYDGLHPHELVMAHKNISNSTEDIVKRAAEWWGREMQCAEDFLHFWTRDKENHTGPYETHNVLLGAKSRPTFAEVLRELQIFDHSLV